MHAKLQEVVSFLKKLNKVVQVNKKRTGKFYFDEILVICLNQITKKVVLSAKRGKCIFGKVLQIYLNQNNIFFRDKTGKFYFLVIIF